MTGLLFLARIIMPFVGILLAGLRIVLMAGLLLARIVVPLVGVMLTGLRLVVARVLLRSVIGLLSWAIVGHAIHSPTGV